MNCNDCGMTLPKGQTFQYCLDEKAEPWRDRKIWACEYRAQIRNMHKLTSYPIRRFNRNGWYTWEFVPHYIWIDRVEGVTY